jgi:thiol-disulfide isomerase/thioredoxin
MRFLLRLNLILILAMLLAGCGVASVASPAESSPLTVDPGSVVIAIGSRMLDSAGAVPRVGDTVPDFEYTLADGTPVRLSELRGKKVILNFWATWCAPCRLEMPALQAVHTQRGEELAVLGVNLVESPNDIVPFGQEFGITFPLIANRSGDIRDAFGALSIPVTYFINSDGTVAERHLGVVDAQFIDAQLAKMK